MEGGREEVRERGDGEVVHRAPAHGLTWLDV